MRISQRCSGRYPNVARRVDRTPSSAASSRAGCRRAHGHGQPVLPFDQLQRRQAKAHLARAPGRPPGHRCRYWCHRPSGRRGSRWRCKTRSATGTADSTAISIVNRPPLRSETVVPCLVHEALYGNAPHPTPAAWGSSPAGTTPPTPPPLRAVSEAPGLPARQELLSALSKVRL
jgi:hypothetical protein